VKVPFPTKITNIEVAKTALRKNNCLWKAICIKIEKFRITKDLVKTTRDEDINAKMNAEEMNRGKDTQTAFKDIIQNESNLYVIQKSF
jgi:hypothetical protein